MFNEYIDVHKDEIPLSMLVDLGGRQYELVFHYNASYDFFAVDLLKDGAPLIQGEKLMLNKVLFRNYVRIDLPTVQLVPADISGTAKRITYNNFGETVFLYVVKDGIANE